MYNIPNTEVWAILLGPGKIYEQQCGGYSCRQESAQGQLINMESAQTANRLYKFFMGAFWGGWCYDGIDEETAKYIEQVVPRFSVNRNKLKDSCEAWIHGFVGGEPAVLTWENSD